MIDSASDPVSTKPLSDLAIHAEQTSASPPTRKDSMSKTSSDQSDPSTTEEPEIVYLKGIRLHVVTVAFETPLNFF